MHTVLVVDDEESVRRLLRDTLELDGYLVHEAADAMQAMCRIDEERPDCIVLDVMMPGMSGIDLLGKLRADERTSELPILMLTAADDDATTWAGWSGGASCYVPKPFDVDHVLDWVGRLCSPGDEEAAVDGFDLAVATRTATRRVASPTVVRQRRESPDSAVPSVGGDVVGSDPMDADLVTELSELYDWGSDGAEAWSTGEDGVRPDELAQALAKGELWVAYQPIVALANEGVVGVEALARWEHPQRGDLSPAEFVPMAERSGLITRLGAFVLGEAVAQVAEWNVLRTASGREPLTLAVNLSPNQVSDPLLCTSLREALDRHGMSPPSLIVELGEPALMRLLAGDQRQVRDLLELGVSIAFDDFSAAATSLSFLQRFHVDVVKVDRSHVRGLDRDQAGDSTVAAIVSIAHRLNRAVVAEGVESVEQADHLRRLGCEYAQGFLFGYPVPATQIAARVLTRDGGDGPQIIEL